MIIHFWEYSAGTGKHPHVARHVPGPALWHQQMVSLNRWLVETYGMPSVGNWSSLSDRYYFAHEADMLHFVITWSGVPIPYTKPDETDFHVINELARYTG